MYLIEKMEGSRFVDKIDKKRLTVIVCEDAEIRKTIHEYFDKFVNLGVSHQGIHIDTLPFSRVGILKKSYDCDHKKICLPVHSNCYDGKLPDDIGDHKYEWGDRYSGTCRKCGEYNWFEPSTESSDRLRMVRRNNAILIREVIGRYPTGKMGSDISEDSLNKCLEKCKVVVLDYPENRSKKSILEHVRKSL